MNIEEVSKTINYLLDNNLKLVEKGLDKIAINIEGECGIGKTAILKQIAEERGAKYTRICLSECEEIGDLVGIPQKEYMMISPNGDEQRVAEKLINQFINIGYKLCPDCDPVMTYAVPSWVPTDPEQEAVLVLDDYTRANQMFMQAIMSLIQFGEYISWKLPKKCHLLLSSNPDNGEYSLSGLDSAQKSRLLTFNVEFDVKVFAKWMEKVELRGEFINFALLSPEIFDRSAIINARTYTMFANALSGIQDFDTPENLALISLIAKGCFGDDDGVISGLFIQFVHNHLDKLITPEQILNREWKDVEKSLLNVLYKDRNYRADIASTLTIRFINYIDNYFKSKDGDSKTKSDIVCNRVLDLVTSENRLLSEDLILKLIKTLFHQNPTRFSKLLVNPKIKAKLLND